MTNGVSRGTYELIQKMRLQQAAGQAAVGGAVPSAGNHEPETAQFSHAPNSKKTISTGFMKAWQWFREEEQFPLEDDTVY